MRHIALLGAGFSSDWGGLLASQVFEHLLGSPQILSSLSLRKLLWKHRVGGFENALSELQDWIYRLPDPRLDDFNNSKLPLRQDLVTLESAVHSMFADINDGFTRKIEFRFHNPREVGSFLAKFDAIFTLNQDLLLERLYARGLEVAAGTGRWKGVSLPGMRKGERIGEKRGEIDFWSDFIWRPLPKEEFVVPGPAVQPIYKLHGSSNWKTTGGDQMLVIGGLKTEAIDGHDVLKWYGKEFGRLLSGGPRLMVIGYSFRDEHINKALICAAESGLRLFVVDPLGSALVENAKPAAGDVQGLFEQSLIGFSRLAITDTLGTNGAEMMKLERFFVD